MSALSVRGLTARTVDGTVLLDGVDEAAGLLTQTRAAAAEMVADLAALPDLYYTGYTQDALKELTEALN